MPPGETLAGAAGTEFARGHLVLAHGRIAAAGPGPAPRVEGAVRGGGHRLPDAIEENEVLAGALSNVELGEEIPAELYKAVAEVLIFVLRLTGRVR